jgi:hypothetical protein
VQEKAALRDEILRLESEVERNVRLFSEVLPSTTLECNNVFLEAGPTSPQERHERYQKFEKVEAGVAVATLLLSETSPDDIERVEELETLIHELNSEVPQPHVFVPKHLLANRGGNFGMRYLLILLHE